MFSQNVQYYSFDADTAGEFASLSFAARLPKSFPRSGRFGDLSVRRLDFVVEGGPDGKKRLVLRQKPLLMDMDRDETQQPLILAKDVNKFLVDFWDPDQGDWSSEWTMSNQLPKMVRITLALGHLDQFSTRAQEAMVAVVALPAQAVRPQWQMPQLGGGVGGGRQNQNPANGNQQPGNQPGNNTQPGPAKVGFQ
jgi:hypothetical protein